MTAVDVHEVSAGVLPSGADGISPPRRRGRTLLLILVVAVIAAGVTIAATNPFKSSSPSRGDVFDNTSSTALATVKSGTITSQTNVSATLGYVGTYSVVNQAQGTITALPNVGQVVAQGGVLYDISGNPVVLLYGSTPAYRVLSEATSGTPTTGPDVKELNADLVALGYVTSSEIPATSETFTYWTKAGVESLQSHLGVTKNGTLALGSVVFLPQALRVTTLATTAVLGGSAQPGSAIISASSTMRIVTIALDASEEADVKVLDPVTISLPSGQTTPGVVSTVGSVATAPSTSKNTGNPGASNTPTITVEVTPTDPAATGTLDKAPVQIAITTAHATHALIVPVTALLALAGGGYAVEVVGSDKVHTLVPIATGVFDNAAGDVSVTGSGLAAGDRVVIPAT